MKPQHYDPSAQNLWYNHTTPRYCDIVAVLNHKYLDVTHYSLIKYADRESNYEGRPRLEAYSLG